MSTVQNLLDLIGDMYPSATTDAVKVKYMNLGQDELSDQFGLVATNATLFTRADEDEYALPTTIQDISQIETFDIASCVPQVDKLVLSTSMKVGIYSLDGQMDTHRKVSITHKSVGAADTLGTIVLVGVSGGVTATETLTPVANSTIYSTNYYSEVTSLTGVGWIIGAGNDTISMGVQSGRYETTRYGIGFKDDKPMRWNCIYQNYSSAGVKSIIIYPAPGIAGLPITIRYHAKLTPLSVSVLTKEPDFDSRYHSLLATYACWQICADGASPDAIQATRFSQSFEEGLTQLWKLSYNQQIVAPRKRKDNKSWHNNSGYNGGYSGWW